MADGSASQPSGMILAVRGNGKCAGTSGPPIGSPVLLQGLACIGPNSCTKLQIDVQMFRIAALQQSFALQNPPDDLLLHFAMHLQNPMFLGRWSTM
jgi:hypothetical protein